MNSKLNGHKEEEYKPICNSMHKARLLLVMIYCTYEILKYFTYVLLQLTDEQFKRSVKACCVLPIQSKF